MIHPLNAGRARGDRVAEPAQDVVVLECAVDHLSLGPTPIRSQLHHLHQHELQILQETPPLWVRRRG